MATSASAVTVPQEAGCPEQVRIGAEFACESNGSGSEVYIAQ